MKKYVLIMTLFILFLVFPLSQASSLDNLNITVKSLQKTYEPDDTIKAKIVLNNLGNQETRRIFLAWQLISPDGERLEKFEEELIFLQPGKTNLIRETTLPENASIGTWKFKAETSLSGNFDEKIKDIGQFNVVVDRLPNIVLIIAAIFLSIMFISIIFFRLPGGVEGISVIPL